MNLLAPGRRLVRIGVIACVLSLLMIVPVLGDAAPARADTASSGSGRFKDVVDWIGWGSNGSTVTTATTGTSTRTLGGQQVTVSCSISNQSAGMSATNAPYGLAQLYSTGGMFNPSTGLWTGVTMGPNANVWGLKNTTSGATVTFRFSCSASAGSKPVPLAGLVIADAEAMSPTEYLGMSPITSNLSGVNWHLIDRYRPSTCSSNDSIVYSNTTKSFTFRGSSQSVPRCNPDLTGVAFMEGATSASVSFHGDGTTAIALGVILAVDHGDAPASYGDAANILSPSFSGGTPTSGTQPLFDTGSPSLGQIGQSTTRLGSTVDAEDPAPTTLPGTWDDVNGVDDEDSISDPNIHGVVGSPFNKTVSCSVIAGQTGYVAGWVDWNVDGDFNDAGERSDVVPCSANGTATLTWVGVSNAVVGQLVGQQTYSRYRISTTQSDLDTASGLASSGETEDYATSLELTSNVQVTKSVASRGDASDQFQVFIRASATNVASATTTGSGTTATTGPAIVDEGVSYTIGEQMAAGSAGGLDDYSSTASCINTLDNDATVPLTGSGPTWTLPAIDHDGIRCTITNTSFLPQISVLKQTSTTEVTRVGQQIPYTFTVTNTGNTTLSSVAVTDTVDAPSDPANLTAVNCTTLSTPTGPCSGTSTTLIAGQSATFTATYATTQADLDNGTVGDTATAAGTPPPTTAHPTPPPVVSAPSSVAIPVTQTGGISVVKSSPDLTTPITAVDQTIRYNFLVRNTGNVTLTQVAVSDQVVAPSSQSNLSPINCPSTTLPGDATMICTATYTVTQADLDNGTASDTATSTGLTPDGSRVTSPPSDLTVPGVPEPSVSLLKSTLTDHATHAGQEISYTFTVTNTGNVTLSHVTVSDVLAAPSDSANLTDVSCPTGPVIPGDSAKCTATYTVTQADLDHGSVEDTATASANPPATQAAPNPAPVVSNPSTVSVPVASNPALTVTKTSTTSTITHVGQLVPYTFVVTNSGNLSLTAVSVSDAVAAPSNQAQLTAVTCESQSNPTASCSGTSTSLIPGQAATYTATYTVTQDDLDHGSIVDSATATGTDPSGSPVLSPQAQLTVPATQTPAITVLKETTTTLITQAGQQVPYTFVITNTGNVTLNDVVVADSVASPSTQANLSAMVCPSATMAPSTSMTCTATYTATQSDVDHGTVDDQAVATGTPPATSASPSPAAVTSAPSAVSIAVAQTAGLTIAKTSNTTVATVVGQQIEYSFTVTNTGNTTATNIVVQDEAVAPSTAANLSPVVCPGTALSPDQQMVCTATYRVTAADLTHGSVSDRVSVDGRTPRGPLSGSDALTLPAIAPATRLPVVSG